MKHILICLAIITNCYAQTQALDQLVYEIRDPRTDAPHFRRALEKIGEYLALHVLQELNSEVRSVETLTGVEAKHQLVNETPVLVTILRAGLPLVHGVHQVFPHAPLGFIAMSRDEETLKAKVEYVALPEIENRTLILVDTMLATGGSLIDALKIIAPYKPKRIFVLTAIAAKPGIKKLSEFNPDIKIFTAAVDPALNEKGYIIPGLGDAGDRSYGNKN